MEDTHLSKKGGFIAKILQARGRANGAYMTALPSVFSKLQPYVAEWALSNEQDRFIKLTQTSIETLREFYDAVVPRAEEIADYLNVCDLNNLAEDERTLFHLLITFVETAHPIELKWKTTDIEDAFPAQRLGFGDASRRSPL